MESLKYFLYCEFSLSFSNKFNLHRYAAVLMVFPGDKLHHILSKPKAGRCTS